jgi:hypothetical protein
VPRIGETQEFDLLEPGVYTAELIDYTDTRADGAPLLSGAKYGEPKPQWRFRFELVDYPEPDRQISAWVNKPRNLDNIAPNATLTLLATALLGVGAGDEWDLEDLLHKQCRLQVEVYTKQDGAQANTIGKYYPAKTGRAASRPPARERAEVPF